VELTDQDYWSTDSSLQFTSCREFVVNAVTPGSGLTSGETVVTINGNYFTNSYLLRCEFGGENVPSLFELSTTILCTSHARSTMGNVALRLSNGFIDYYRETGFEFEYLSLPIVSHIYPALGSQNSGTLITVWGKSFSNRSALSCRFGGAIVDATFVNATLLTCTSPKSDFVDAVTVEVSTDGQIFSTNDTIYSYIPPIVVCSMSLPHRFAK
jgi:hypothetical protein